MPDPTAAVAAAHTSAVLDRLFNGAAGLPLCWVRRVEAAAAPGRAARVFFDNLSTGRTELALPTEPEYTVILPPTPAGEEPDPLGVSLEANFSGLRRVGWRSGRRASGTDSGAVIRSVNAKGALVTAAAAGVNPGHAPPHQQRLRPGHHLIAVNGASVLGLPFAETVAAVRGAGRPALLRFHDPYAIPAALAAAAADPSATPATLEAAAVAWGAGGATGGVRGRLLLRRGVSGAVAARLAAAAKAEAREVLDLSLDALVRVAGAAAASGGGDGDAAWAAAAADPALLRLLCAAATGAANDAADPAAAEVAKQRALRQRAAAGGDAADTAAAAGASLTGPAALRSPATSDETARRALAAFGAIASVGGATGSAAALAMAKSGVLSRSLEAMAGTRSAAGPYAEAAVATVGGIVEAHALLDSGGAAASGFTRPAAVAIQARIRSASGPSAVAAASLGAALSRAFPDQDAAAFLALVSVR